MIGQDGLDTLLPKDWSPLWISLKTALSATAIAAVLGILAAWWMLNYRGRGRSLIDGVLTLPLVLPPTVVGFLLLLLLGKNSPLGQVLDGLGISLVFTWGAVVIAATVVALPLMYKTVLGAFEQVDSTLLSAARTLGASEWRLFWQVLVPLAWPGVLAGTVLAFARALGEFGATLMVGGSIPGITQTIPIAIFFAAEGGRMGVALVWVALMVAVSLGAIAGLHQASARQLPQARSRPRFQNLLRLGFNYLYLGSLSPKMGNPMPNALASTATAPPSAPVLSVHFTKEIPGFCLQIKFKTGAEPLGLLGASGSGKSMTLRCIAGLETPSHGQIVLNGRVLFDRQRRINVPSRARNVGLVFQNYALFPHLTLAQNIAFGMNTVPQSKRAAAVSHYLDRIELAGLGDRYPSQISGGQQQRVALARAIASQPDILLLDEPLSALDAYLRPQIEQLLLDILATYPGITLFITHKLEEAYRVCTNLLVLSGGNLVAAGPKAEIFHHPPTLEVAKITECKNLSPACRQDATHLEALAWQCALEVIDPVPNVPCHVGLRAHHIQFPKTTGQGNTFPGWLAHMTETQHKVSLFIKLHTPPRDRHDYHLQAEVYREKWELLRHRPFPWNIRLDPVHLMILSDDGFNP